MEGSADARAPAGLDGPQRTCIGCRGRERRDELLRLVVEPVDDGHRVVVDLRRVLPGRGASLHRDLQCYVTAARRRAFHRALRVEGTLDLSAVEAEVSGTTAPAREPTR